MKIPSVLQNVLEMFNISEDIAKKLIDEVIDIAKARGIDLRDEEKFLDIAEYVLLTWSVVEPSWEEVAKYSMLLRIYREAGKKFLKPSRVEERLSYKSLRLLRSRYLLRGSEGRLRETPRDLFTRVASFTALAESRYGGDVRLWSRRFLSLLEDLKFLPNSPTLMNAATREHQLAACFVIPVEDDTDKILEAVRICTHVFRSGAGAGIDFSRLRPRGDIIEGTGGKSSGPVSFMKLFDVAAEVIKEGGKRRAALMGILQDYHPDVLEFIKSKVRGGFENFNISVGVHDLFMKSLSSDSDWALYNPRTCREVRDALSDGIAKARELCKPYSYVKASDMLKRIAEAAWASGDPGIVFIDTINKHNPTPKLGRIHAVNPCVAGSVRVLTPEGFIEAGRLFDIAKSRGDVVALSDNIASGGERYAYRISVVLPRNAITTTPNDSPRSVVADAMIWKVGVKDVVKVVTREGYEIVVTPDHMLMTPSGWRRAEELRPGDKVVLPFLTREGFTHSRSLGSDLAYVLGLAVGARYGVELDEGKRGFIQEVIKEFRDSLEGRSVSTKGSGFEEVMKLLNTSLGSYHEVLNIVFKLRHDGIKLFLEGLFIAAGSVSSNGLLKLTLSNKELLRGIQLLLLQLGVTSEIREQQKAAGNPAFVLVVNGHDVLSSLGGSTGAGPGGNAWRHTATVKQIEYVGRVVVYDITVPLFHTYVAEGFINHNCGETPLLDWEACNLGSINLSKYVGDGEIAWDELGRDVEVAIRFLDDVIDMSLYPDRRIEEAVLKTRKVGLGVMGLADALIKLGVRYDSNDALYLVDKLMEFIAYHARVSSNLLARERGAYPAFHESIHAKGLFNWEPQVPLERIVDLSGVSRDVKYIVSDRPGIDWEFVRREMVKGTRNATVTTVAPTGSISIIANTTSGIEPLFALVFLRESGIGTFIEVYREFFKAIKRAGLGDVRELLLKIAESGGVEGLESVPKYIKNVFRTAHEISPSWHVKMQAVVQRWVDNAVSKTVNMRVDAGVDEVAEVFTLAWRLGCKGITVYRDRSKASQVVKVGKELRELVSHIPAPLVIKDRITHKWYRIGKRELIVAPEAYAGGCPSCDI